MFTVDSYDNLLLVQFIPTTNKVSRSRLFLSFQKPWAHPASPEGRIDNSPRFQAWVCRTARASPEGTAEPALQNRH